MNRLLSISLLILMSVCSFSIYSQEKIKIVVTAAFVSERGMPVYQKIADYISKKSNYDVSIVSNLSYKHADLLLDKGVVQVGFVCGLPYTHKKAAGKQELIAIPVMAEPKEKYKNTPGYKNIPGKYYSYTIVRKDSDIKNWAMLKGKSYVYNDLTSNSGYNMPRYKLIQLGAKSWEDYFNKITVSGSHEESIRMVAEGLADASSVDSLVLDFDRHLKDKSALNVKVIETLFPDGAGIPPVVISTRTPIELREKLKSIFLNMHKDKEGEEILNDALLVRFNKPDDSNYDDIRRMEQAAKSSGFTDHKE